MSDKLLSRRTVLKTGLLGAGLLTVGGLGLSLQGTVLRQPSEPLIALSQREYSILAAIADRLCPSSPDAPTASQLGVAEAIDTTVSRMDPATAKEFRQLLALFENAAFGFIFNQTFQPFTACSPATQDRVIEGWRLSAVAVRRSGYRALAGLCLAAYWANPKSWSLVGYPGPPQFGLPAPEPLIVPTRPEGSQ